jgi:hypothetical protein
MIHQLLLPKLNGQTEIGYPEGFKLLDVPSIFAELFKYIFPAAGLILFFVFIAAGFQMMTSAGNEEQLTKASNQLTSAVVGFVIVFASFWIIRLIEFILGVKIF